ncbi:MAG: Clp protease N-terminal domain-containing protein [Ktedonobacteraceae bacterium]
MSNRNRFDKFDEHAKQTLGFAQVEAQRFQHNYIGTEHLLLGLLDGTDCMALLILKTMGIEPQKIRDATEFIIGRGDRIVLGEIGLTPRAKKVIELAVDEARQMNHDYIGTEHILLGLVREGEGIAAGVLESFGVTLAKAHHHTYLVLEVNKSQRQAASTEAKQHETAQRSSSAEQSSLYVPPSVPFTSLTQGGYDPFTARARKVLDFAQEESSRLSHNYIGTEHLLLGLLDVPDGVAMQVLDTMGVEPGKVRSAIDFIINHPERILAGGEVGLTPRAKKVLELSVDAARRMNLPYVGTEHILLGLVREGEGIAAGVLASVGVNFEKARRHTIAVLGIHDLPEGSAEKEVIPIDTTRSYYSFSLQSSGRAENTPNPTPPPSSDTRSRIPFDKFTERTRRVLSLAQEEAQRFQHNYIGTEHLLLGLVREREGVAAHVLKNLGVELDKVRSTVEFIIGRGDHIILGEISLTPRAKKVIELAVDEARQLNHPYIGTEHLLLGLVREGEGIAVGALESLGVSLVRVRAETLKIIKREETPNKQEPPDPPASDPPASDPPDVQ